VNIALTFWKGLRDPKGQRVRTTWAKLLTRLSVPRISADKHDVPGLSLATFKDEHRSLANVEQVFAVGIDLDHLDALSVRRHREPGQVYEPPDWDALRHMFPTTDAFVHSTWSSTLQLPRLRVFFLLSRPVSAEEYRRVYQGVAEMLEKGGLVVDRQASDPSRLWFLPSIAAEGRSFVFWTCNGAPINVDGVLEKVPAQPVTPRPPIPVRPRTGYGGASPIDRARAYLQACPAAISGSGGHAITFVTAQKLVRGFSLTEEEAFSLLANDWNPRCSPPWSESALRRKVHEAMRSGRHAVGDLVDRERSR
jgi:hypothetical protein